MNENPFTDLWKIFHQFSKEYNIQNIFIKGAQDSLRKYYKPIGAYAEITSFLKDKKINPSLEDVIFASTFLIILGIELSNLKYLNDEEVIIIENSFNLSAKFFDLILKYEKKSLSIERYRKFLLFSAISYDLSNKSANCIVQINEINKNRDNSDIPIDTFERLEYYCQRTFEFLLARQIDKCKQYIKQAFDLKESFDVIAEEAKKTNEKYGHLVIFRLLAMLEIISGIDSLTQFMVNGNKDHIYKAIKYIEKSGRYFLVSNDSMNLMLSDLLILLCKKIEERSIFNYLEKRNDIWLRYINSLIKSNIFEFWPSQIECLKRGLFSNNNFVICAPTSAGKSLMAELAIVDNISKLEKKKCFYIVPSRALANQMTNTLKKRLNNLDLNVIKIVGGVNEKIDNLFFDLGDVCVCTPEKFYQLHKKRSKIFEESNLVIIDEAHLIGSNLRGLNLEFEITTLLNNYKEKRLILISAVVKNFIELSDWIKTKSSYLFSQWKPTRTINAILDQYGSLAFYNDLEGFKIDISDLRRKISLKEKASTLANIYHNKLGMTLIFSKSKPIAEDITKIIYEKGFLGKINNRSARIKIELLCDIIKSKFGSDYPLIRYLKRGLTFHHGSLPNDIREKIEELIEDGIIKIIVSTTTLAEGINTPVSCLIIPYLNLWDAEEESYKPMSKSLFKNLSGRTGRALINTEGYVILIETPRMTKKHLEEYLSLSVESIERLESYISKLLRIKSRGHILRFNEFESKSNLRNALFQNYILSALIDRTFDGFSISNFIKKTFFGLQASNKKEHYQKSKILIKNTLETMENLPEPVVIHASPYRATKFGRICYETGLSPVTMNLFLNEINILLDSEKDFKKNFSKTPTSFNDFLNKWFSLFALSMETRNQSLEKKPKDEALIPNIIYDWLNGESFLHIKENYFGDGKNSYRDTVDFIQNFIVFYGPWLSYGLNKLLQDKLKLNEMSFFLKNLPSFLLTGTMNWNEMMLISFEICDRNLGSKEIAEIIQFNEFGSEEKLIRNFIINLKDISFDNLIVKLRDYPQNLINEIWKNITYWQKILENYSLGDS